MSGTDKAPVVCALCGFKHLRWVHHEHQRTYWSCERCQLVQVSPTQWCSPAEAKAVYDQHEQDVYSEGHRRFLARTLQPLRAALPPPAQGLDFGSGPAPTLATWLREEGYQVSIYDELYAPHPEVLNAQYDFITATEVLEHLQQPLVWLDTLWECLKPGGVLVIQSKRVLSEDHLAKWHYLRDPTHIIFFRLATWQWMAQHWQTPVQLCASDVVLLRKPLG